jgi:polar amino acid transport system ATP-binding protein
VTAPLLRVSGVRKAFGDHVVLDDLSLDVEEHRVVVLIGASGSGKSTLLRCINLLEEVDDGVIEVDGQEVTDPRVDANAVRARIGMVFQAYNLFPHLRVLDNVALAPGWCTRSASARPATAPSRCSSASASARRPARSPTSCPAASSSASPSPGRW